MKKVLTILFLSFTCLCLWSSTVEDSLRKDVQIASTDSLRRGALYHLGYYQFFTVRNLAGSSINLFAALQLADRFGFKELSARCNEALSWIEERKGNAYKAVQYSEKAYRFYHKSNNNLFIFKADYNLGSMLQGVGDLEHCEYHLANALKFARRSDNKSWIINSLQAIGRLYRSQKKLQKAKTATLEAAQLIMLKTGTYGNGRIPSLLAQLYSDLEEYEKADLWMERAFICAKKKGDKLLFKEIYFIDFELKKKECRSDEALVSYELYILYKDSVFSEDGLGLSSAAETQYYRDLKELANEKKKAEKKLIESEQIRSEQQQKWMWGIILVFLIALIIVFQRFRVTSKQKTTIQQQKLHVDEKNKEIMDSIAYAKRIQAAILPSDELVQHTLPESFVFYLPKNVVAGDFYWLHEQNGLILIAAADCTGHGVPGAMVSVVCNNALNRSVREYGLTSPAEILDKTRSIVIEEFEKSAEEVKDGMDISLCSIRLATGEVEWAGANNPIWIIKKGSGEIHEIKGDKQPIGKYDKETPFQNHQFELQKGDLIYLFSDGFVDQFGGANNKKYRPKQFKEFLVSVASNSPAEQKLLLKQEFQRWKGNSEQVDDICVVGIKV
ncbi:MAG: SpoIIE family protein phosphatase [Flavobacteriales bacterium]|nr:SpoIIE family protein phosphatase [Flavobacteriales bacterium]